MKRMLIGLAAGLLALPMLAAVTGWLWLRSSLPRTTGTIEVAGLGARATIARDAHGVPRIGAASEEDAVQALGYAHAQDRFFQMEYTRRLARGRLAELFGDVGVERDSQSLRYRLTDAAAAAEQVVAPRSMALLRAYAAGVNAWLASRPAAPTPELALLGLAHHIPRIEPWTPRDSMLVAKLFGLELSRNASLEVLRRSMDEQIAPARRVELFARLFPRYPDDAPTIVPSSAPAPPAPVPTAAIVPASQLRPDAHELFQGALGLGSNAWVVAPRRTAGGHALVANDPHVRIDFPSIFYLAAMDAPGLHVIGATLPGLPSVIIGRNERIVWGVAVLPADTQDLFVEQVDPHDPTRYLVENGGTLPFDTRDESIPIAGRAPVHVRSRATRHGPVLYEDDARPLALRAVALDPDDTSLDGYFALQHARDFESFRAALGHLTSPSLSFVYADVEGHIGYVAAGRVPRRDAREGWLALDGPTAGAAWPAGYLTAAEMPTVFDPPEGFLVAANNRVGSSGPAAALAAEWSAPYRAARLRELIATHARLTPDGAADLQADVDDAVARALVPTLRALVPRDARERTVEDLLAHWNLRADGASAAAAVFVAWRSRLLRAMVEDELTGETLDAYLAIASGEVLVDAVTDPHAVLCDDVRTPARESCTDLARATFAPTLDALVAAQGSDPGRWRLDHLQAIDLDSAIFDTIPLLGSHFARHVGVGGDAETVRVSGAPFFSSQVVTASALFAVMEAAPGVAPRFALLGGESGHPLGTHARDQLDAWTHNVPFAIAGDGSSGTVVLVPAR